MEQQFVKTAIVVTTIHPPTEAIRLLAQLPQTVLYVVGDRKTPTDWNFSNTIYISPSGQQLSGKSLAGELPWDHYCRKMMGYLAAIEDGAAIIVDTDDDNLPLPEWRIPDFSGSYDVLPENAGFVNVYSYYTGQHIWPRGFPLPEIHSDWCDWFNLRATKPVRVGIWQGLVDKDPDVDAIYRLTQGAECFFERKPPIVFAPGSVCPFNSQNTIFAKELFPLLYLPVTVTFRFTDILRGLVAQPIMWSTGLALGFLAPTVIQERNPHDFLKDFIEEIPCYLLADKIVNWVINSTQSGVSLVDNLYNAYQQLVNKGVLFAKEIPVLEAWLQNF